jgi:hypothetical protein
MNSKKTKKVVDGFTSSTSTKMNGSIQKWTANNSYQIDEIVWYEVDDNIYRCIANNSDATFVPYHWATLINVSVASEAFHAIDNCEAATDAANDAAATALTQSSAAAASAAAAATYSEAAATAAAIASGFVSNGTKNFNLRTFAPNHTYVTAEVSWSKVGKTMTIHFPQLSWTNIENTYLIMTIDVDSIAGGTPAKDANFVLWGTSGFDSQVIRLILTTSFSFEIKPTLTNAFGTGVLVTIPAFSISYVTT